MYDSGDHGMVPNPAKALEFYQRVSEERRETERVCLVCLFVIFVGSVPCLTENGGESEIRTERRVSSGDK